MVDRAKLDSEDPGCLDLPFDLAFLLKRISLEQLHPLVVDRDEVLEQVPELRGIPIRFWNEPQTQAQPLPSVKHVLAFGSEFTQVG